MNEQTRADIRKAVAILKEKGWTQEMFVEAKSGKVCLVGALRIAIFGTAYPELNFTAVGKARRDRLSNAYEVVYDVTRVKPEKFNDNKKTRKRHVLRALKDAEARA